MRKLFGFVVLLVIVYIAVVLPISHMLAGLATAIDYLSLVVFVLVLVAVIVISVFRVGSMAVSTTAVVQALNKNDKNASERVHIAFELEQDAKEIAHQEVDWGLPK